MHESTMPMAKPRPAFGKIKCVMDVASGICKKIFNYYDILTMFWKLKILLTQSNEMPMITKPSKAANHRPILCPNGPNKFVPIK